MMTVLLMYFSLQQLLFGEKLRRKLKEFSANESRAGTEQTPRKYEDRARCETALDQRGSAPWKITMESKWMLETDFDFDFV